MNILLYFDLLNVQSNLLNSYNQSKEKKIELRKI